MAAVSEFDPATMTKHEVLLVLKHRREEMQKVWFNKGIETAAIKAEAYGREAGNGYDEGYRNLANAIRKLYV